MRREKLHAKVSFAALTYSCFVYANSCSTTLLVYFANGDHLVACNCCRYKIHKLFFEEKLTCNHVWRWKLWEDGKFLCRDFWRRAKHKTPWISNDFRYLSKDWLIDGCKIEKHHVEHKYRQPSIALNPRKYDFSDQYYKNIPAVIKFAFGAQSRIRNWEWLLPYTYVRAAAIETVGFNYEEFWWNELWLAVPCFPKSYLERRLLKRAGRDRTRVVCVICRLYDWNVDSP